MKKLFDKTEIKGMELKNRLIRSAMHEGLAGKDGEVSDELLEVYENIAKGGVAAIVTGFAFTMEGENPSHRMLAAYDDKFIEGFKKLTDTVHKHDTKIILQVASGGSQAKFNYRKRQIYGASAVEHKFTKITPIEMSESDIEKLVNAFGDAALRAKQGGFDAIQIHGAHGYLHSQFLAPYYNRRTDKYGGNIENRARIIFETYQNMREKAGEDFPIWIKINCSDFLNADRKTAQAVNNARHSEPTAQSCRVEESHDLIRSHEIFRHASKLSAQDDDLMQTDLLQDGFTFEECKFVCKKLDEMGIDFIEISGNVGFNTEEPQLIRPDINKDKEKQCYFAEYAKKIAEEVKAPVSVVGGNRNFAMMSESLNDSNIEYFSLARTVLCEPDIVNKWKENPDYDPKCISCNKCFSLRGNICIFNRK